MEFWVVAAATGAGYVAKHWQNLSGDKDGSPKLSHILSPRVQPDTCQLFRKMPNSVSGSAPIFIEKQVFQDNTNHINGNQHHFDTSTPPSSPRLHEFRTKNANRKSFSSLRPLAVSGNGRDCQRKQATQVNDVNDHKIFFMEENGASVEANMFEPIGSVKLPRRPEKTHLKGNGTVSLLLGITIGILSTIVTNQHEIEHLNELLEQAGNIVQDLHNRLEAKEGFTTKETGTETDGTTQTDSPEAENLELTSDIEAELEAELERLEENMKSTTLQRLSDVVEIDSDFEADIARGDLNLDALNWQLDSQSESDNDKWVKSESTGKPAFTPNYIVSPLDLRLRLHEVIESELRTRIDELEAILKNQKSQSKPHSPEPQEEKSFWDFDHTRIESSSSTP
ncbi:DNA double-strand break repair Rad50 ATPase [Tanacetum coccineum]